MVDKDARAIFNTLVTIKVGKGDKVLFWRDRWIHGFSMSDISPRLADRVDTRNKNTRTVSAAPSNERWMQDFDPDSSLMSLM